MVDASLNARKRKLEEAIETDTAKVEAKRGKWNTSIINDMEEELQQKKSAVRNITAMLSSEGDKKSQQKFSQMKKRRAVKLFEAKRIKRRAKTTQGNTCLIDSDDEDFIAKCIEDKATYHGRRHDLIMYTNKRVKKRDLLNIANYRLLQKKKKLVKSATTVYNRSKPRSSRSIQAKRHRGKGLFCSKKPPKAEDADNENTHFQRAHVKNVKFSFFGKQSEQTSRLCFMRSIDDKAYLRPGTSEGFNNTRNQKILTTTDIEKARKLPKYDWPEKLLYQTPGAHRIFTKESCMSEEKNEEKLVTKNDSHFVFVRPKAIIESSGTTWASETIRLRQRHPDLFDVQENCEAYSTEFRQACATIENACFLYDDMTETEDLSRAQAEHTCIYTQYECKRLQHLKIEIKPYLSDEEMMDIEAENKILLGNVKSKLEDLTEKIDQCLSVADRKSKQQFQNRIRNVAYCCRDTIALIKDLKIPVVKPRWCDLTDAGTWSGCF